MLNVSKEQKLQLDCLRSLTQAESLKRIETHIGPDLDWTEVLESAGWHGIEPILYFFLKDGHEESPIPAEVLDELKTSYYRALASNMALYYELNHILELFNRTGLDLILLKGAALAKTVYRSAALRPMTDIDILVKKHDVPHAERLLDELGYKFRGTRAPDWYRKNYYHLAYVNREKKFPVEVHWHIANSTFPPPIAITDDSIMKNWWAKSRRIELDGEETLSLAPEHLLFLLCIHFLKHRFQSPYGGYRGVFSSRHALIQMQDIISVIKFYQTDLDWDRFYNDTENNGVLSVVASTLVLVKDLLELNENSTIVPPRSKGGADHDEDLADLIRSRLFNRNYIFSLTPESFIQSILDGNFKTKVRNLAGAVIPDSEFITNLYSLPRRSKKRYFYYPKYLYDFVKRNRKRIGVKPTYKEMKVINKWIGSEPRGAE